MEDFWMYVCDNLTKVQENYRNLAYEFMSFSIANNLKPNDNVINHPEFSKLSEPTRIFVQMHHLLKDIDPGLTIYINMSYIHLPDHLSNIIMHSIKREIGDDYPDENVCNPLPIIIRYELILSTGDPLLAQTIDELLRVLKNMTAKKITTIPNEWVITKFKERDQVSPHPFSFHNITISDQIEFILQKVNHEKPASPSHNPVELIIMVRDSLNITTQDDIEDLKHSLLLYIDSMIGEARSFIFIRSITILPEVILKQQMDKFPKHYKLQQWSEFNSALTNVIPQAEKCKFCTLTKDNTDFVNIVETTGIVEKGNYCRYCFKLLARLTSITGKIPR